jgi:hypothetical protein
MHLIFGWIWHESPPRQPIGYINFDPLEIFKKPKRSQF